MSNDIYTKTNIINEEMIPIAHMDGGDFEKLKIRLNGYKAECFIISRPIGSDKLVIQFDEEHPEFGDSLVTKYFRFEDYENPVLTKLHWGHNHRCEHFEIYN
tara:strand:+ start:351 stop:656 length:306 start_codon:yes stop_codon:yes gene_type:complete